MNWGDEELPKDRVQPRERFHRVEEELQVPAESLKVWAKEHW